MSVRNMQLHIDHVRQAFIVTSRVEMCLCLNSPLWVFTIWNTKADSGVTLVNTVADNGSKYTNEDYLWAVQGRELQIKIGRPSLKDFLKIIAENQLPNYPLSKGDIMAAEHIFWARA